MYKVTPSETKVPLERTADYFGSEFVSRKCQTYVLPSLLYPVV